MPVTFAPASIGELEKTVAWAVGEDAPLEIIGNGTKRGLGRPVEATYVLETTRLAGIDLYEPDELVMSAGCRHPLGRRRGRARRARPGTRPSTLPTTA